MRFFCCLVVSFCLLAVVPSLGQTVSHDMHKFTFKGVVLPVALFASGVVGSQIDSFKEIDFGLRGDLLHIHNGFVFEDAVQYMPVGALYALKLSGVKSLHNYADATALVAVSYCISASATWALKHVVNEVRPNGRDSNSFPSGHSAVAFMGAELLRMEYKDTSPWIGFAGYTAAVYTSLARIRHAEHWLPDVLAGAGIGIIGTRVAYWITPSIKRSFLGKRLSRCDNDFAFVGLPFYNGSATGVSLSMVF